MIYQPAGAPVVYAAGGQQCAQAAGMSQQSMCAGVPPTGMASQHGTIKVVDPRMVTGVVAAEGIHGVYGVLQSGWTLPARDLADLAAAREKEKMEELRSQVLKIAEEAFARGKAAIQQDMEN